MTRVTDRLLLLGAIVLVWYAASAYAGDIAITPNPTEVASWFEAPVAHVLNPANQTVQEIDHEGARHRFVEIVWQGHVIWGVTGAILSNLAKRLEWAVEHG